MVDEIDRPLALGTDLHPRLERLPVSGFDPKGKRAGLVDLGYEEIEDSATLVDPGPGRIQEDVPVRDRKGYVPGHGFGQHHQPQGLREIPVLLAAEERKVHGARESRGRRGRRRKGPGSSPPWRLASVDRRRRGVCGASYGYVSRYAAFRASLRPERRTTVFLSRSASR